MKNPRLVRGFLFEMITVLPRHELLASFQRPNSYENGHVSIREFSLSCFERNVSVRPKADVGPELLTGLTARNSRQNRCLGASNPCRTTIQRSNCVQRIRSSAGL